MIINFIIGDKQAKEHFELLADGQKIISSLIGTNSSAKEYKNTYFISNYAFIEFDKYMKQYAKFTSGQKIFFILQFLTTNQIENIYFFSKKPDMDFFKTLLNCWKDEIIIQYYNEKFIKKIQELDCVENRLKFEKLN